MIKPDRKNLIEPVIPPASGVNEKTFPARLAKRLLLSAEKRGGDIDKILDGLDFSFNPVDPAEADSRIPVLLYCKLLRRVALHSEYHLFGFTVDENDPMTGLRLMCMALLACGNLEKAIQCTADFYRRYGKPGWQFSFQQCDDSVLVSFDASENASMNAYDIAFLLRLWSWLSGQFIEASELQLEKPEDRDAATYKKLFDCDLQFDQIQNRVTFSAAHMRGPIVQDEESLTKLLEEAPYQLLIMSRNSLKSIVAKIRFIVGSDFTKGFPSKGKIADMLHISSSSLQRRLAEEGTSYQQLKDELRKEAAIKYLHRPELSVIATAGLMGFDDPCAFNRTFKRWTGLPPGVYRRHSLDTVMQS